MSEKHRNAQKLMPQSRKLLKYQKRKIRRYLKRVRWRRKRRQRYFLYGLALAVSCTWRVYGRCGNGSGRSERWM